MKAIMKVSYIFKLFFMGLSGLFIIIFITSWAAILLGIKPLPKDVLASFLGGLFWLTTSVLFFYFIIMLFKKYEMGKIFSLENILIMRNLGIILVVKELIPAIVMSLSHQSFFQLANMSFESVLMGVLLVVNSWIMKKGYFLKQD